MAPALGPAGAGNGLGGFPSDLGGSPSVANPTGLPGGDATGLSGDVAGGASGPSSAAASPGGATNPAILLYRIPAWG